MGSPCPTNLTGWSEQPVAGNIIKTVHANELRAALIREYARRGLSSPAINTAYTGNTVQANLVNTIRNYLVAIGGSASSVAVGQLIYASYFATLRSQMNTLEASCVCNCDYACTCNCNYACTCNCNYSPCSCNCNYGCTCDCLNCNHCPHCAFTYTGG